jgi:DNA-binding response OmpR family regulator
LRPELIIADYNLDEIAFVPFCERLAGLELLPHTPLIALVNPSDRIDEAELRFLGVKAFLEKPLRSDDLVHTVKKLRQESAPNRTAEGSERVEQKHRKGVSDQPASQPLSLAAEVAPVKGPSPDERSGAITTGAEEVERTIARLLPDLLKQEVRLQTAQILREQLPAQVAAAFPKEETIATIRRSVQEQLPPVASQLLAEMKPALHQGLADTAGRLIKEIAEKLVLEQLEPAVSRHLPAVLEREIGALDTSVRKAVQEVAAQQVRQAAEAALREAAKGVVEEALTQVLRLGLQAWANHKGEQPKS